MWPVVFITVLGILVLRLAAHALILRGLRAPKLAHQRTPADVGLTAQTVRLPVAEGKNLFAWFVPVPKRYACPLQKEKICSLGLCQCPIKRSALQ